MPALTEQVVCCEYLHAVPDAYEAASAAMRKEASLMLHAVVQDLLQIVELKVVVLRGRGVPEMKSAVDCPQFSEVIVENVVDLHDRLCSLCRHSEFTFVIAPECNNVLAGLIADLESAASPETRLLNLDSRRCALFADKLQTNEWLMQNDLPCIPTIAAESTAACEWSVTGKSTAAILKPRDGVGSDRVQKINCDTQLHEQLAMIRRHSTQMILQPFISGATCSIGMIGGGTQTSTVLLKPALQRIVEHDGHLEYCGGEIPCPRANARLIDEFAPHLVRALGSFHGYIGVDLIVDINSETPVRVVEINPRLCTSYVGYRRLADENLMSRVLQRSPDRPVHWKAGRVVFDLSGDPEFHAERSDLPVSGKLSRP